MMEDMVGIEILTVSMVLSDVVVAQIIIEFKVLSLLKQFVNDSSSQVWHRSALKRYRGSPPCDLENNARDLTPHGCCLVVLSL